MQYLKWICGFANAQGGSIFIGVNDQKEVVSSGLQKSLQKTLSLIADNPYITAQQIADKIGITRVGVAKQLKKLQEQGFIRRIGPDKGGHWDVSQR